jgi:hypothetical protein
MSDDTYGEEIEFYPDKLKFAPTGKIERYEYLFPRFYEKVLDMDYRDIVFVSDESSLWDYVVDEEEFELYLGRIEEEYGVDVSEIEDGNLIKIFEGISS